MSNDSSVRSTLRSVDSVANIYAIVIGLALTQAIQTLIAKDASLGSILNNGQIFQGLPAFLAILFTLVPFWHGMNRHLDRCYITKTSNVAHQALLFDFSTFFVEGILLFAAAWSLRTGLLTFYCLGLLLAVDMLWGGISHLIHFRGQKSHVARWSAINIGAGLLGYMVCSFPFQGKPWALMVIAIFRTILDYWLCSAFYFPNAEKK